MISVVIPARNAGQTIEACLRGALAQNGLAEPHEVILVDDGSSDDTAARVEALPVRVLRQPVQGPAAARNAGAREAQGEILAFTDADCIPSSNWLQELTRPFADGEIAGTKGVYRTRQRNLVARFVQLEYESKYQHLARRKDLDFIDTYSAAYRREVFLANDGFDPLFPTSSVEDQELAFRLARKGYRFAFAPQAVVEHQHAATLWAYARKKFTIGYWKAVMLRWLPERMLGDAHTPRSLQAQIVMLALLLAAGAVTPLLPWAGWIASGALLAFFLSGVGLLAHVVRRDAPVLAVAPILLIVRAAALGLGLGAGLLSSRATAGHKAGPGLATWILKRLIDIAGAALGLVLTLPILLFAMLAIVLDSPGSPLFVQERTGQGGRTFRMVKLRTMVRDAQSRVGEALALNPLHGPVYKVPNDPRVTRVGRVLRRWSLDELPQLWNVLVGDMSLVGPRPEETWVVAQYDDRQRQRLAMKPGLTGPMQVGGRGALDLEERLQLELDYIRNYSLGRDLAILLRTPRVVFSGRGAL